MRRSIEDIEDAVNPVPIEDRTIGADAGDGEIIGDVEVTGGGCVLSLSSDRQEVRTGRKHDRIRSSMGVCFLDCGPQRAGASCGGTSTVSGDRIDGVRGIVDRERRRGRRKRGDEPRQGE